ncbi:substrate-binding domain-containing protein [Streptomyces sp. NPDC097617]|uniref:substrate-binding domain-containing protein n=1 Tax=Streptomyces sp. NPDC097617 TaxID=3366091 RepID=UPI00382A7897
MKPHLRASAVLAALTLTATLAACSSTDKGSSSSRIRIGLLLPENETARYEKFDKPLMEKRIALLTFGKGKVLYANAGGDAARQNVQVDMMIESKVDVLVVDPVDSKSIAGAVAKAKGAGIPVVAYDRLAEGPIDAYTSFYNETVGRVQGEALLTALGDKAKSGKIVMMHGAPTDPNAGQYKSGVHKILDGKVNIDREYDTADWNPENARTNMTTALSTLGKEKIVAVYSANDGMAGGVVTALKAAGYFPLPLITGQDAELRAVQRIVTGDQFMTVYKSYAREAEAAAELAVALAKDGHTGGITNDVISSPTTKRVPTIFIPSVPVTRDNIRETVVLDAFYTVEEICTDALKAACSQIDLTY